MLLVVRSFNGSWLESLPAHATEVWLSAGLVGWLAMQPEVRGLARFLDRWRRAVLGCFLAMLVLAQYGWIHNPYPFTDWGMYAHADASRQYATYTAVTAEGSVHHVPFTDLAPTTSVRAFMRRVDEFARRAALHDSISGSESDAARTLRAILAPLAAGADPTVRVDVHSCWFEAVGANPPVTCRPLVSIDLSGSDAPR